MLLSPDVMCKANWYATEVPTKYPGTLETSNLSCVGRTVPEKRPVRGGGPVRRKRC